MNKKLQGFKERYLNRVNNIGLITLYQFYKTCSPRKQNAWEEIVRECSECDGYDLTVVGGNSDRYSAAYTRVNPDNGNLEIVYHTSDNVYYIDL